MWKRGPGEVPIPSSYASTSILQTKRHACLHEPAIWLVTVAKALLKWWKCFTTYSVISLDCSIHCKVYKFAPSHWPWAIPDQNANEGNNVTQNTFLLCGCKPPLLQLEPIQLRPCTSQTSWKFPRREGEWRKELLCHRIRAVVKKNLIGLTAHAYLTSTVLIMGSFQCADSKLVGLHQWQYLFWPSWLPTRRWNR